MFGIFGIFSRKNKQDNKDIKEQKELAISEEMRIANDIIRRFTKWVGNERREKEEAKDFTGLERRHSRA